MTDHDIAFVKECILSGIHRFYVWSKWLHVREQVLEMDKHECQDCKANGRYTRATTVHHNQFVKRHPEFALEIWYTFQGKQYRNLISLCNECHEARHNYRQKNKKVPLTEEMW